MKHRRHIPLYTQVGGQRIDVLNVERCDNDEFGNSAMVASEIQIADICCRNQKQSDQSKVNTYYHELVHLILNNMGRTDLNNDEPFVCAFAGFLTEAMVSAEFPVDQ